jgi:hypothetical protein
MHMCPRQVSFSFLREKRDAKGRKEGDKGCARRRLALQASSAALLPRAAKCAECPAPSVRSYDPSTISIQLAKGEKLTPAMQQYWDIKKNHQDVRSKPSPCTPSPPAAQRGGLTESVLTRHRATALLNVGSLPAREYHQITSLVCSFLS